MNEVSGPAVDKFLPYCWGIVGTTLFRLGDVGASIEATEKALTLCKEIGDVEGVKTYIENLRHIRNAQ